MLLASKAAETNEYNITDAVAHCLVLITWFAEDH